MTHRGARDAAVRARRPRARTVPGRNSLDRIVRRVRRRARRRGRPEGMIARWRRAARVFDAVAPAARARRASDRAASTMTKILDGSVFHLERRRGVLVGTDVHGNAYYEDVEAQQGRSRWVAYANPNDYSPANVPREWHGWLHYVNDEPGLPNAMEPMYEDPVPTFIRGQSDAGTYLPKGHFHRDGGPSRDWKKYQSWTPN